MRNLAAASLVLLALGCSSGPAPRPPECDAIAEECHPFDPGSGDIHECHENAESVWTAAECASNHARCSALCVASDAGADDSGVDAAH